MGQRNQKNQTTAAMRVRVRPSVKAAAVRMAQEDKCSMAEWLEWLIEAEAARLGGEKGGGGWGRGGATRIGAARRAGAGPVRRVGKGAPSRRAHHLASGRGEEWWARRRSRI